MLEDLLGLPWDKAAAFVGFWIAVLTLAGLIGTRWGPFRRWLGRAVQEMLGIAAVNESVGRYIAEREKVDVTIERAIERTVESNKQTRDQVSELLQLQEGTQAQLQELSTAVKDTNKTLRSHITNNSRHVKPTPRRRTNGEAQA